MLQPLKEVKIEIVTDFALKNKIPSVMTYDHIVIDQNDNINKYNSFLDSHEVEIFIFIFFIFISFAPYELPLLYYLLLSLLHASSCLNFIPVKNTD